MAEEESNGKKCPRNEALLQIHSLLLQALRHREQDLLRFLAILGPALAGVVYLHSSKILKDDPMVYILGMYAILGALVISCVYTIALGYNYRYLTLQLAKLESDKGFGIHDAILNTWPRSAKDFIERYSLCKLPWCNPPGNINVFYWASIAGIVLLLIIYHLPPMDGMTDTVKWSAENFQWACIVGLLFSFWQAFNAGRKLRKAAKKEEGW